MRRTADEDAVSGSCSTSVSLLSTPAASTVNDASSFVDVAVVGRHRRIVHGVDRDRDGGDGRIECAVVGLVGEAVRRR